MKHTFGTLAACGLALVSLIPLRADDAPRERVSLDVGWRFVKGDEPNTGDTLAYAQLKPWLLPERAEFGVATPAPQGEAPSPVRAQATYDDSSWRQLNLPHDWGIEGPFDPKGDGPTGRLPYWGVGWYRRHLQLPASDSGRHLFLQVDGAMSYSEIWLNGHLIGGWPYGYASYQLDLTPWALPGKDNVLAVRLENLPQSSRWYPGAGIYRNIWLLRTTDVHVGHWGTQVTTPKISPDEAKVALRVQVEHDAPWEEGTGKHALAPQVLAPITVHTDIYELGPSGQIAGEPVCSPVESQVTIPPGGSVTVNQELSIGHPMLWSPKSPYRYVAVTTVTESGRQMDKYQTPFGVRTLEFNPDRGLLINGEPVRIQGVCDHHDLGALGTAINVRALERQLTELQEMGCNALRTSHNPPAPELLDLCDKLGIIVMDESFDCWAQPKRPNDYHLVFPDWHEADLRALVRRDRNHPSVIMWSIGNEIPEQKKPIGVTLGKELQRIVHEEDPTRPDTSACNNAESGFNGFFNVVDVFGYNYHWAQYPQFRADHPKTFLYGSETASTVSSRGVYVFPLPTDKSQEMATPDFQVSSYDLSAPRWAWPPDDEFRGEDENPGAAGEFVWTGWDYIGEPTPYGKADDPSRSSYFGIIDLAGFKKDRFYLYQSRWKAELPMAHLVPHWTWPDRVGKQTPVEVYTSGDEAELFLNGKSLGRRRKGTDEYRLIWQNVIYQPGELKVVAYRNGKEWATDVERTAGEAAKLQLQADHNVVRADGQDLIFVSTAVTDAKGVLSPRAHPEVTFSVSGPGDVVAVDDGDATSYESFQSNHHKAFNGLVLAIVRTHAGEPGAITVTAKAPGLADGSVEVRSDAVEAK